jgi:hypothetical protein
MARFIGDYQKVAGIHESGTYAQMYKSGANLTGSAYWIGQVTEHSIDDNQNYAPDRYMGTSKRTFDSITDGPRDVTGTLTYHPHDVRLLFYAIGTTVDNSGATLTTAEHSVSEIASNVRQTAYTSGTGRIPAPMSFSLEDSKQSEGTGRNFNRDVNGCVINTATLTLTPGEKASMEINYIAERVLHHSGATVNLINSGGQALTPYMWDDCLLTLGGQGAANNFGSPIDTAKSISLEINKNMTAPHYLNGSRVIASPYEGQRDYILSVTLDLDGKDADWLYTKYFRNGSSFTGNLDMNADVTALGSKHVHLEFSGCRILSMDNPSDANVDVTETTMEIQIQNVTGSAWDRTHKYNPW